ncbi:hypothetical protein [Aeromonas sp. Y311-2]|nr:hypothetical protein [Aeromonas sp. Y311-2]
MFELELAGACPVAVAGDPLPVGQHRERVLAGARRAAGDLQLPAWSPPW